MPITPTSHDTANTSATPTNPQPRKSPRLVLLLAAGGLACSAPDAQSENTELEERVSKLESRLIAAEARTRSDLSPVGKMWVRAAEHHHPHTVVQGLPGCGVDGGSMFRGQTLVTRSGTEQCSIPNLGLRSLGTPCSSDYDVVVTVAASVSGAQAVTHRLEVRDSPPDSQGNGTHGSLEFDCAHPALVSKIHVFQPGGGD